MQYFVTVIPGHHDLESVRLPGERVIPEFSSQSPTRR
jgi:hypothetical protein